MLRRVSSSQKRLVITATAMLLIVWSGMIVVMADGGQVITQQSAGPYLVTVFAAPVPPRAGLVDLTIFIQRIEGGDAVLDARVEIALAQAGANTIRQEAIRGRGQNQLLYGALLDLPRAGDWDLSVEIKREQASSVRIGSVLTLAPARAWIFAYWRWFLLPPVVIVLFIVNQILKRRMRSSVSRDSHRRD